MVASAAPAMDQDPSHEEMDYQGKAMSMTYSVLQRVLNEDGNNCHLIGAHFFFSLAKQRFNHIWQAKHSCEGAW